MSLNLLVIYEIADKASQVSSKKAFRDFEKWIVDIVATYRDSAIERVANIHLFKLRDQFST